MLVVQLLGLTFKLRTHFTSDGISSKGAAEEENLWLRPTEKKSTAHTERERVRLAAILHFTAPAK